MKRLIKNLLSGAVLGIAIGFGFALIFSTIFNTSSLYPSGPWFVTRYSSLLRATQISALLWALIGEVWTLSQYIWLIERWSITKQTIWHLIITYSGMTILAVLSGWFPLTGWWFTFYTLIYIAVYAGLWSFKMYRAHQKIAELNALLPPKS